MMQPPPRIDRDAARAAGYTDAEIDAFEREQLGGGMERAPDGPFAQSRGVPMQDAKLPAKPSMHPAAMAAWQGIRGMTGGLADRGAAAVASALPGVDYSDARRTIDGLNRDFAKEHPVAAPVANILGALIPTPMSVGAGIAKGVNAARRAAQGGNALVRGATALGAGTLAGGAAGAAGSVGYQSGEDDRDAGATVRNALTGLGGGALLGGAATALAPVASRLGSAGADLLGLRQIPGLDRAAVGPGQVPRTPGTGTFMERLLDNAPLPQQASRRADFKAMEGITDGGRSSLQQALVDTKYDNMVTGGRAMVADRGGRTGEGIFRAAKDKSGTGRETLEQAFLGRDKKLGADVRGDIAATISGPVNTVQAQKGLSARATKIGNETLPDLKDEVFPLSTETKEALVTRGGRVMPAIHKRAQRLAMETEGVELPSLFQRLDDGSVTLVDRPLQIRELDYMRQAMQEMRDAKAKGGKGLGKLTANNVQSWLTAMRKDAAQTPAGAAYEDTMAQMREVKGARTAMQTAQKGGRVFGSDERVPSYQASSPDELRDFTGGLPETSRDLYDVQRGAIEARAATKDPRRFVREVARNDDRKNRLLAAEQPRDAGSADELVERATVRDAQVQKFNDIMRGSRTAESLGDELASGALSKSGQLLYAARRALGNIYAGRSLSGLQGQVADQVANRGALSGRQAEEFIRYLIDANAFEQAKRAGQQRGGYNALAAMFGQGVN